MRRGPDDEDTTAERYLDLVIQMTLAQGGSTTRPGDCTARPPADGWQFPRHPGKTVIIPPTADLRSALRTFILVHARVLHEPDCWLGTWRNPHDQQIYLDITTQRADLAEARQIARSLSLQEGRQIVALFNPRRQETVYLWDDATS
jgi:hypothetical protein